MQYRRLIPIAVFTFLILFYFLGLDKIPSALYCDEARIGLTSYRVLHGNYIDMVGPFFYNHFIFRVAALAVYLTVPFIWLFGLTDQAIRMASVAYGVGTLLVVYYILNSLKIRWSLLAVVLLAATPVYFHLSRVQFAQTQPIFLIMVGYLFFIKAQQTRKSIWPALSGICLGVSMYGNSQFLFITPLMLFCMLVPHLARNGLKLRGYNLTLILLLTVSIVITPLVRRYTTDPELLKRFNEKITASATNRMSPADQLVRLAVNYPKYYSPVFLFSKGELGMPGAFISRHSITDIGLLPMISFPLLVVSYGSLVRRILKRAKKWTDISYFLPFFILFPLYPLPDLITTNSTAAPYTVAIFPTLSISVAFIGAYGIHVISQVKRWGKLLIMLIILSVLLHTIQLTKRYLEYPANSSDYYGWQAGAHEIMDYFLAHKNEYDDLFLSDMFNEAIIWKEFYDPHQTCKNCQIGSLDKYDPSRRQLYALRMSQVQLIPTDQFVPIKNIYLPNGQLEFVIGNIVGNYVYTPPL